MSIKTLEEIKAAVSNLEETQEGQLRGGFSPIGGDSASPLRADIQCVNAGCTNDKCNVGCAGTNDNYMCINIECKPTSPVTGGKQSSIGMTFAI